MKRVLFIFFLVLVGFVHGQIAVKQINEIDSTLKLTYLSRIFPLDDFCVFVDSEEDTIKSFINIHSQNFSFYRTDSEDTIVVFDGKLCGGYESGLVTVYKFVNGNPQVILTRSGQIAELHENELVIYTHPCCAEIVNVITSYSLLTGERFGMSCVFYSSEDYSEIINSFSTENEHRFILTKDSEIHYSASADEKPMVPLCNNNFTNVIGTLVLGQKGQVMAQSKDGWALVRLDSMPALTGYCLNEYYRKLIDSEEYILFGWMKVDNMKFE